MQRRLRNNGLTLVLLAMFLASFAGQAVAGFASMNRERAARGQSALTFVEVLRSGQFWSAAGENWESEFLQMFFFIWLTTFLFQKGSPESNDPDRPLDDEEHEFRPRPESPWPVRRGGIALTLYAHSLTLAFALLFLASFVVHVLGGVANHNEELVRIGQPPISALAYLGTSQMWFESFQNWQSEFLSVAAMVYLAVFLRERGSPESKRVSASHTAHE